MVSDCQLVLGDAHDLSVDPRLVTVLHRVVGDCHAHIAHCARAATASLSAVMVVGRSQAKKMGMTTL